MKATKYPLLLLAAGLAIAYISLIASPDSAQKFALNSRFYAGEFYRLLAYQFVHISKNHLLENLIGLGLVAGIATELKTVFKDFTVVYFLAGALAALPLFFILNLTLLGASAAIFGAFGFVSLDAAKFRIRPEYMLGAVALLVFSKTIYSVASCGTACADFKFNIEQDSGHFMGLVFGASSFYAMHNSKKLFKNKKRFVLRGVL